MQGIVPRTRSASLILCAFMGLVFTAYGFITTTGVRGLLVTMGLGFLAFAVISAILSKARKTP
ncbi:MAG TPA: hypothetical protein DF383_11310 [Deltaproteobacteria bacterium]|nr:hypothetical protein [Deltaproteobacteria bacterium]